MSVGLLLRAQFKNTPLTKIFGPKTLETRLHEIESWILEYCARLVPTATKSATRENPVLYLDLHPAAENIEISLLDECLTVYANTSSVGPGYHIFVCDMLHNMATDLNLRWDDPTEEYFDEAEYFETRNPACVFEAMESWLRALSATFADGTIDSTEGIRLALAMNVEFFADASALTPLGPRTRKWLEETAKDGRAGRDFFAWYTPGFNAEYYLGRALARMWTDVRWRPPATESERKTFHYVLTSLAHAYELDPTLDYPWAEWEELRGFSDAPNRYDMPLASGALKRDAQIGYRRRNVRVQLPGYWWIELPGSFSNFVEQDDASCAVDPPYTVWFNAYKFTDPTAINFEQWRQKTLDAKHGFHEERDGYISTANFEARTEDGHNYFVLLTSNVCFEGRSVCTIVVPHADQCDWALRVWKSLTPPVSP